MIATRELASPGLSPPIGLHHSGDLADMRRQLRFKIPRLGRSTSCGEAPSHRSVVAVVVTFLAGRSSSFRVVAEKKLGLDHRVDVDDRDLLRSCSACASDSGVLLAPLVCQ
jgi:hypothetical protein